jgi:mannose-6-phosphate isomerase-like protein (cupin superfamily)
MDIDAVISDSGEPIEATGASFAVREWAHGPNSGPPLHIHHHDDEAWHVIEGALVIRVGDRSVRVEAGGTAFVPAGVAHTFSNPGPTDVRYLLVATPRILELISALHGPTELSATEIAETYRRHDAELVE